VLGWRGQVEAEEDSLQDSGEKVPRQTTCEHNRAQRIHHVLNRAFGRVLLAGPRGDELPMATTARSVSLIGLERGEIVGVQVAQELTISLLRETSEEHVKELANSPIFEVGQSVGKELLGICKNDDDDVE